MTSIDNQSVPDRPVHRNVCHIILCIRRKAMGMRNESSVAAALANCVAQLDAIFVPWAFTFTSDEVAYSHRGYYASGHYCRGTTRIGLSCRDTIDHIYYEHSFVTKFRGFHEVERFVVGHEHLMQQLGHAADYRLRQSVIARDRRFPANQGDMDVMHALIHDLECLAAPVLRESNEQFSAIMRTGHRYFTVKFTD